MEGWSTSTLLHRDGVYPQIPTYDPLDKNPRVNPVPVENSSDHSLPLLDLELDKDPSKEEELQ
jgi:hypothetical protein